MELVQCANKTNAPRNAQACSRPMSLAGADPRTELSVSWYEVAKVALGRKTVAGDEEQMQMRGGGRFTT